MYFDESCISLTAHARSVCAAVGYSHDPNEACRESMEDEVCVYECHNFPGLFIGLYDGHGGRKVAELLKDLLYRIFLDELLNEELSIPPPPLPSPLSRRFFAGGNLTRSSSVTTNASALTGISGSGSPSDSQLSQQQHHAGNAGGGVPDGSMAQCLSDEEFNSVCSTPPFDEAVHAHHGHGHGADHVDGMSASAAVAAANAARLSVQLRVVEHSANTPELDVVSAFCRAYKKMDTVLRLRNCIRVGATSATAFIRRVPSLGRVLTVANCGDCTAVLSRAGRPVPLTISHRPTDPEERDRVETSGGFIAAARVNGVLNVTRAFGNHCMKSVVISTPFVTQITLTPLDEFLVIACDGLWDFVPVDTVLQIAKAGFDRGLLPHQVAHLLVKEAIDKHSTDNISVLIIQFDAYDE